ncbi:hypothetical protein [Phytoactinopolyspora halotolerans]|uniref:Uncharacterized protein n=1 Tax=Phytoactinopolyspora halotolerans TaxID=1981512 RepID=A0A6L9S3S1_9ACTN|nr:hypothetical protein [Phytoactinopolyspora halotolerans]NED99686.1 hypothetical protein [Phytoactinopolyspora halotolerans]
MRVRFRLGTAAACAAAALLVPTTALALPPDDDGSGDGGGGDGSGYSVEVRFTDDGGGGDGDGGYTDYVPAACWWVPIDYWPGIDPSDPEEFKEYFYEEVYPLLRGHAEAGQIAWPDMDVFDWAIELHEDGHDVMWYEIECRDSHNPTELGYNMGGETEYYGETLGITNHPFILGEQPEPGVDPEELAEEARDRMVIEEPEIERNPKGTGTLAGATLVNLPTWFWATNPEESIGGPDGERTIRAEVVGGDVWAEVTARTDGLSIASPAGSTFCEPALAIVEWTPGADDSAGCTVEFSKASVQYAEGYPVAASTEWSATWEGVLENGEQVGGDLEPLAREITVDVPVAESQATVRQSD